MNKYQWIFGLTVLIIAGAIPYLWVDAVQLTLAYLITAFIVFCIFAVILTIVWLGDKE